MCGACGELRLDGRVPDVSAVATMAETMVDRGPDGAGVWSAGRVALGHRRLKIIDLSEAGAQPMVDPELGLAIAWNGCIYNYPLLRAELSSHGYRFFSHSDTEVLIKAYHHWGDRFVDHLAGMFAFAIVERDSGRVLLGRDRLGIKPLYLSEDAHRVRFASSLPALLDGGDVDTRIDPTALHHYLSFHSVVPPPRTILRGVTKVPPATLIAFEPDGRRIQTTYWSPDFRRRDEHADWSERDWEEAILGSLRVAVQRRLVADVPVGALLSGGVDSSVVAALLHRAIGDQLTCVFVDNGLLRLHEGDQVMQMFAENMGIRVIRAEAESRFLGELAGVSDPEAKRKIIGRVFIDVFAEEARKLDGVKYLAQGTIYPDVIESAASKHGKAHVIKSHHNVGGLPDDLAFELVEPLRDLFKDEVRKLGTTLGLPHSMIYRHPFPGPGLGVRILGEVKKEYADILRQADAIFMEELRLADWYDKTAQAFAVFQPVKSVGVVGDGRRYAWVIALRAVETVDFMTARFAHLPYELIDKVSTRIMNEIKDVARVTYDVSSKPPATIEWE